MTSLDPSAPVSAMSAAPARGTLLNPVRLRLIARLWIAIALVAYVVDLLRQTRDGLSDGIRRPFGDDFVNYWSGAYLAFHGRAAEVYDFVAFHAFERSITGPNLDFYHYSYPPVLLLMTLPLALVPYVAALGVWLVATWYGFYRALRLTESGDVLLMSLAAPALFVNAVGGQNGALTAALLGGGLMLLDRRPIVAGILFGLMIYKPHLGLMLPFALIAGRRWLPVGVAALTASVLVAASIAAFGAHRWVEYADHLSVLRIEILEDGAGVWHRMVSVFVFARRLGAGLGLAYVLQTGSALVAAVFVAQSWLRGDPAHLRNGVMIMGTCLATPYLQDYDLVMGAFVVTWLQAEPGRSRIPAQWIKAAMAIILLAPAAASPLAKATGLAFGPVFIVPVFAMVIFLSGDYRRAGIGGLAATS
jgi:Glycosyltransferase family 87